MEKLDFRVNHLPALTWVRLGVNFAEVKEEPRRRGCVPFQEKNTEQLVVSGGASEEATSLGRGIEREKIPAGKVALYETQAFSTALGGEFEKFMAGNANRSAVYRIPAGVRLAKPVILSWDFEDGAADASEQLIVAEDGAEGTFLLVQSSPREAAGLSAVLTRVAVGKGARVKLIKVGLLGEGFVQLDDTGAQIGERGRLDFVQLALGGAKTYAGCCANEFGRESEFTVDSGYSVRGSHLLDLNFVAVQRGAETRSSFSVKGVLRDAARKVFRGTIDFRNGSKGSSGEEQEDVLLLDDEVVNKTVPVILCEEEDVEGRHGATIGKLPEDVLFYMGTRGISGREAERIMIRGRLLGVAAQVPEEDVRGKIAAFIEEDFGEDE